MINIIRSYWGTLCCAREFVVGPTWNRRRKKKPLGYIFWKTNQTKKNLTFFGVGLDTGPNSPKHNIPSFFFFSLMMYSSRNYQFHFISTNMVRMKFLFTFIIYTVKFSGKYEFQLKLIEIPKLVKILWRIYQNFVKNLSKLKS